MVTVFLSGDHVRWSVSKGAVVALVLLGSTLVPGARTSGGVAWADPGYAASDAVPGRVADLSDAFLVDASPGYLLHQRQQYDENEQPRYSVVRVSDGATVSTFHLFDDTSADEQPTLLGASYVLMLETSTGEPSSVDVHDDETGVRTSSIDLRPHDHYVHGDLHWALVADDGVAGDDAYTAHVVGPGGAGRAVDHTFSSVPTWIGGDDSTAYVDALDGAFAVDSSDRSCDRHRPGRPGRQPVRRHPGPAHRRGRRAGERPAHLQVKVSGPDDTARSWGRPTSPTGTTWWTCCPTARDSRSR